MKRFLAIYLGSEESPEKSGWKRMDVAARKQRQRSGVTAREKWAAEHANAIVDQGTPIGKTKRVDRKGVSTINNAARSSRKAFSEPSSLHDLPWRCG